MEFNSKSLRILTITLTAMLAFAALGTVAEDGTSGTLPESLHSCELVTATYSPISEASPVASPVATPVDDSLSANDPLTEDLTAATHAILDCMSDRNLDVLLQLTGSEFRASWIGLGTDISDEDFEILLPMMASLPYALVEIEDVQAEGENATATVRYTIGRQVVTSEWSYSLTGVDGQNVWQVQSDHKIPTEIPDGAAELQIVINDGSFAINTDSVESGDIVINVMNVGEHPHEVLIVRAPAGTEASDFAASTTGIPTGGTFVGQLTLPPGTQGDLVLTDVRAGTYTIVDLLPGESGIPNVSDGMITELIVE